MFTAQGSQLIAMLTTCTCDNPGPPWCTAKKEASSRPEPLFRMQLASRAVSMALVSLLDIFLTRCSFVTKVGINSPF